MRPTVQIEYFNDQSSEWKAWEAGQVKQPFIYLEDIEFLPHNLRF